MIHDAQFDYYARRLATASSDKTIRVFDVSGDAQTLQAELRGHEGPVWEVSWAHPKFGALLASCSYDRKVKIWKEGARNDWACVFTLDTHELSVNSVCWAPVEYGLQLACGSSDGDISILALKDNGQWDASQKFHAHQIGVNAVSWAPPLLPSQSLLSSAGAPNAGANLVKRLVTAGSDNLVKVWRFAEQENRWRCDERDTLEGHGDWVRDAAWAPSLGLPSSTIASCSQDGSVIIWTQDDLGAAWAKKPLPKFSDAVWRLSWSVTGNILAISGADNKVTLWKEAPDGEWTCLSTLDEAGAASSASSNTSTSTS